MEETVTISLKEYQGLRFSEAQLEALEGAGVDNWIGYEEADWPNEDDFYGPNGVRPQ